MADVFQAVAQILKALQESSTAVWFTTVGIILLGVATIVANMAFGRKPEDTPGGMKGAFFTCLFVGIICAVTGPSVALYKELWNTQTELKKRDIQVMSTADIRRRLEDNTRVRFVIRLIGYNSTDPKGLPIEKVQKLGPSNQLYSFVADYEELKGRTVAEALTMIGNQKDFDRVTAIIFPLPRRKDNNDSGSFFYPANARGLLQVIRLVESQIGESERYIKSDTFNSDQLKNLKSVGRNTYPIRAPDKLYADYCPLVAKFFCSGSGIYRSRDLIGQLYDDWHPLGFSQKNPRQSPCSIPEQQFCAFSGWDKAYADFEGHFGARAFLIENLDVNAIVGRTMIDFTDLRNQRIPEIALPVPDPSVD
ncbi:hypothetical protein [Bradyrhizobium neotropicale]|uniref:hypothetical protein n=1 Tax=Bradyrhizobium neotropicale TaxID=1497615 RepID=UPI001AD67C52|nr:hypothetical protein [Bradyrhizobium neotropicale]MBO4226399.1 hypothetical protein [Bradyrhizobium neotropicale]